MQSFNVKYSRNKSVVAVLILLPLLIFAPVVVLLVSLPSLPYWILLSIVCVVLLFSILTVTQLVKRQLTVSCTIQIDETGLEIQLLKHSLFYPVSHYKSSWSNIENVSSNFDPQLSVHFYQVSFRHPSRTINLWTNEEHETVEVETEFGKQLLLAVEQYNEQLPGKNGLHIYHRGFYESWWAKALTVLAWLVIIAAVANKCIHWETVSMWRVVAPVIYSGGWLSAYYLNKNQSSTV